MTVMLPSVVNAHSHAFHRVLRGRTHSGEGSFWTWRDQMYSAAKALTPALYEKLATAVYAEMVVSGYTAVGEFHYLHHRADGSRYPHHDMELALARAASNAGIRLVLLDTCYLDGGFDLENGSPSGSRVPPNEVQQRFSDGNAESWLQRLASLRQVISDEFDPQLIHVGAAVHSVRAVSPEQLKVIAEGLDPELVLHVHLSEQPKENSDSLAATGLTPTALLAESGLLSPRTSAVHATHLTDADIQLLGEHECTVVMCPTTEADLADGIGPAHELAAAGAHLAIGSDQHAVIDPWQELRALEYGERLNSGIRGRFSPNRLLDIASTGGLRSLGLGKIDDVVGIAANSLRTSGSRPDQLVMSATAADVRSVSVAGRKVASDGVHAELGDPAILLAKAIDELERTL